MSKIRLYGNTSGYVDLTVPDTASNVSLTLPTGGIADTDSPTFTGTASASNLTVSGLFTLSEVSEVLNSGTISSNVFTANIESGNVFYITTAPSANFTINLTNVPTTNDRIFSFAFFVVQGSTGYIPSALQIDGSSQTIKWSGGSAPTPTSSAGKIDVFGFSIIRRSSTWEVLASVDKNY